MEEHEPQDKYKTFRDRWTHLEPLSIITGVKYEWAALAAHHTVHTLRLTAKIIKHRSVSWWKLFLLCLFPGMEKVGGAARADWHRDQVEMDQDYERRLLRQINHQNLPGDHVSKVRSRLSASYYKAKRVSVCVLYIRMFIPRAVRFCHMQSSQY